ncbi:uncharacterized protein LOC125236698 [Leguminivora glycinivorella]|uniref:uncharacterized protein LOC125236698 n=1 Tax=Leguminivora glycinivorella TaxID=1035111 RepID=UPI00200FA4B8|nr:uncharacterized protein LOC125236698 [Leguminivora glycinivorella]
MGFLLLVFTCCMKCAIKTLAMNQSYSESDVSLSPTQILERLHLLRQLQLLQQDKLLQQRQLYQESPRNSSITEVVSQFSASTSFNTFRSLLSSESSTDPTPRLHSSKSQLNQQDLVEGVAVLNLSQESEFIITSPISSRSKASNASQAPTESGTSAGTQSLAKKQISLDDMPVLTPKKDFEALIIEKLKNELDAPKPKILQKEGPPNKSKKPFLKRGEGLTRFGLQKNKPVIQSTYALPWKKASDVKKGPEIVKNTKSSDNSKRKSVNVQIVVSKPRPEAKKKPADDKIVQSKEVCDKQANIKTQESVKQGNNKQLSSKVDSSNCELHGPKPPSPPKEREIKLQLPTGKHPILANKGKTWAAVLTKEQDDFLRQLKQSDYYKNFTSPAKSILSDISCDETLIKLRQEREMAEQNMFELLENKVDRESFNLNNSFINRFLQGSSLEYSGDSTPVIMQRCLASNPKLMTLYPNIPQTRNETCQSDVDCNSEYTECCSDACSSECSCSCNNTIEESNNQHDIPKSNKNQVVQNNKTNKTTKEADKQSQVEQCHNDKEIDSMTENMAEMNAKLVATSELLKDRLHELEDEIETFRKENTNLTKMREEIDMEKQKFYEEKSTFEQKFNEEKILSEYYLAEEKEKLTKQKQIYERQVREMRGRLNKKDKDEVVNLKKEISDLKEEMRLKDAKYTTVAARLRNQLKIMEKEKKDLQEEVEKLKKENRRIQHSNDITRRMTNMKYLEEINKKLSKAKSAQAQVVQDADMKYKTLEMERQSRSRVQAPKNTLRVRAKSVPNLNVTSRYAKYFSQRDVMSPTERNHTLNIDRYPSDDIDDDDGQYERQSLGDTESLSGREASDNENDNSLEKIYMERFQEHSKDEPIEKPRSSYSSSNHSFEKTNISQKHDTFFIHRSNSGCTRESKSPNCHLTANQLDPFQIDPSLQCLY